MRPSLRSLTFVGFLFGSLVSTACGGEGDGLGGAGGASLASGGAGTGSMAAGGVTPIGGASGGQVAVGGSTSGGSQSAGGTAVGGAATGGGESGGSGGVTAAGGSEMAGGAGSGGAAPVGILVPVATDPNKHKLLVRDEGNSAVHWVDLEDPTKTWHVTVPKGRELQIIGQNRFLIGTENGYEERSVVDGSVVNEVATFAGTIGALRLRNGNTLLTGTDWLGESGIVLIEVDSTGAQKNRIVYPEYNYARLVRPTPAGTYLITSDITILEGNAAGKIIWKSTVKDSTECHSWKALRLPNGETAVTTGYEASIQFFGPDQAFLRRIKAPTEATPFFFSDFQILSNGNYLVANWQDHGTGHGESGLQVIELKTDGSLAWSWKQDASFVSSIQAVILLDGMDLGKLYVEDTTGQLVAVN